MATGVYAIRCLANGKVYVGSAAVSTRKRWENHRRKLRGNRHENKYLQAAWDKHGEDAFEFVVIEECAPADCIAREQHWIDSTRATDRAFGFNLAPTAGSSLGYRHTEAAKAKVSAFFRGRKLSVETRAKMSAAHQNPSPEYRELMSRIKRGEVRSPETRAKIGAANRGKKLSEETRAKIGAASLGRRHSEETKSWLSSVLKGRRKSDATRAKMIEARRRQRVAKREAALAAIPLLPFMLEDEPR